MTTPLRSTLLTLAAAAIAAAAAFLLHNQRDVVRAASPIARNAPVLVELFTSEGCSSCPPADALLRELDGTVSSSGQRIVALSEHVTYWNSLGWKDPFSAELFTTRQASYSDRFHLDSAYTPQAVVNGSHQLVGSDRHALLSAIAEERSAPAVGLHILEAHAASDGIHIDYTLDGAADGAELYAAVADDHDESHVERGENGGRTLTHISVVRSLARVQHAAATPGRQEAVLPAAMAGDGPQHLVLFLQRAHLGPVLGTDAHPIA